MEGSNGAASEGGRTGGGGEGVEVWVMRHGERVDEVMSLSVAADRYIPVYDIPVSYDIQGYLYVIYQVHTGVHQSVVPQADVFCMVILVLHVVSIQGYLGHEKQRPPRTLQ